MLPFHSMKWYAVFYCCVAAFAQTATPDKPADSTFKGLRYRSIGPARGGRSLSVAGLPGDVNTYYFGAVGGGVWKSMDGAMNWSPVFDKYTASIGAIAVAPSDPNVLYVGTGEAASAGEHLSRRWHV